MTVCQSDVFQSVSDTVSTSFVCVSEVGSKESALTSKENRASAFIFLAW